MKKRKGRRKRRNLIGFEVWLSDRVWTVASMKPWIQSLPPKTAQYIESSNELSPDKAGDTA